MTKILLAIDTATYACSAAILNGKKLTERFIIANQQHTQLILPMINEILNESGLTLSQINAIAFSCGPGSFTGIRLAASITQAIAFAKQLPIIPISTLQVTAQTIFEQQGLKKVFITKDARMNGFYIGKYSVDKQGIMQQIEPDSLVKMENLPKTFESEFIHVDKIYPHAKYLAKIALLAFLSGKTFSAAEALPNYLNDQPNR